MASAPRATSRAPLAQPCLEARLAMAVTVRHPANTGAAVAAVRATATPTWAAMVRDLALPSELPGDVSDQRVHHQHARGRRAITFTPAAKITNAVVPSAAPPVGR